MKKSIARDLRFRLSGAALIGATGLFLFVVFNVDRVFDIRYQQAGISGLAYEIADHIILPIVVVLLPIMLAMPKIVKLALRPLGLAADRINAASGQERGFRVALDGLPIEAIPFAASVNDLLTRLDDAAGRQEAFAADIAHELKTPLAILALELEGYADPVSARIKSNIVSMNRLVDQLLLIAQLDADAMSRMPYEKVSLRAVASGVSARAAYGAVRDGKKIELVVVEDEQVEGRPEAIGAALRNLIENALRVTDPGGTVCIFVGPGRCLRVQDSGPGLTPEQLRSLSQRLKKADHASTEGAGLGLSIVMKIMASHAGTLETTFLRRELRMSFPANLPVSLPID